MISKKILNLFKGENDLGNKIYEYYVYGITKNQQIKSVDKFEDLLNNYSAKKLIDIGPNNKSKELLTKFSQLKKEKSWNLVFNKWIKGLIYVLNREIKKAEEIEIPDENKIVKEIKKLTIYDKKDIIKVIKNKKSIEVNYLSLSKSPEYNKKFEAWRDTQFIFILNYEKGLFIWKYLNVHKSLRGKGLGTKISLEIERVARTLGFKRFIVQYPNRGYWTKHMNYHIPNNLRIGSGLKTSYTIEGYKEL